MLDNCPTDKTLGTTQVQFSIEFVGICLEMGFFAMQNGWKKKHGWFKIRSAYLWREIRRFLIVNWQITKHESPAIVKQSGKVKQLAEIGELAGVKNKDC